MALRIYKDGRKVKLPEPYTHSSGDYRLICKACGVAMPDIEPMNRNGEHIHPSTVKGEPSKCAHAGESVVPPNKARGERGSRWVEVFRPKKYRRARARAAKAVSKLGR